MTITYKAFLETFEALEANFNFKTNAKLIPLIYEQLKHLSDNDFTQGFNSLMAKTRQEWSEQYDYGKTPTVADWPNLWLKKTPLKLKDQAAVEVEKILHEARYSFSSWKPNHEVTKKLLDSVSLKTIHFDLFDTWNENHKNKDFYRKNLIERWIAFSSLVDEKPLGLDSRVVKALPKFN